MIGVAFALVAIGLAGASWVGSMRVRAITLMSLRRELIWTEFGREVGTIVDANPANLHDALTYVLEQTARTMNDELRRQDELGRWSMPPRPGEPWPS